MSYEPAIHEIQMLILRHLLFAEDAGFAELQKSTALTSDHFNFHVKKLIDVGYLSKNDDGRYQLTPSGKEYANRMDTNEKEIEKQPKISVLLLIERNADGVREFLQQQRLKQPFYGFWGRFGGKVTWGESFEKTASRELEEETRLKGDFTYAYTYRKRDYRNSDKDLLEDKVFIVMHCTNPTGTLISDFEGGHNEWLSAEELANKEKVFEGAVELSLYADDNIPYFSKKYYHDDINY